MRRHIAKNPDDSSKNESDVLNNSHSALNNNPHMLRHDKRCGQGDGGSSQASYGKEGTGMRLRLEYVEI